MTQQFFVDGDGVSLICVACEGHVVGWQPSGADAAEGWREGGMDGWREGGT